MSDVLHDVIKGDVAPLRAVRTPASGPCGCARYSTCWHRQKCRSGGVVRILRANFPEGDPHESVVLCRECAAPTPRNRVA